MTLPKNRPAPFRTCSSPHILAITALGVLIALAAPAAAQQRVKKGGKKKVDRVTRIDKQIRARAGNAARAAGRRAAEAGPFEKVTARGLVTRAPKSSAKAGLRGAAARDLGHERGFRLKVKTPIKLPEGRRSTKVSDIGDGKLEIVPILRNANAVGALMRSTSGVRPKSATDTLRFAVTLDGRRLTAFQARAVRDQLKRAVEDIKGADEGDIFAFHVLDQAIGDGSRVLQPGTEFEPLVKIRQGSAAAKLRPELPN